MRDGSTEGSEPNDLDGTESHAGGDKYDGPSAQAGRGYARGWRRVGESKIRLDYRRRNVEL